MDEFKHAYEMARLRQALSQAAVLAVPVAALIALSPQRELALALGALLLLVATSAWWRGQSYARGVLRGATAGLVPFALAAIAMQCGPGCHVGGHCLPWCVPACTIGGAIAAGMVARAAPRGDDASNFWLSAGGMACLTGALGCSCYSLTGAAALVVAFVAVSTPAYALRTRA